LLERRGEGHRAKGDKKMKIKTNVKGGGTISTT
jgi:hypothetical protein